MIHIGFNTVRLKGEHFEAFVKEGDVVTKGQRLVTFDIGKIEQAGYSVETPIIITNTDNYLEIIETKESKVIAGDVLLTGLL
ncbi:PTS system beta-glucoside-specific EIIBCA component [compost metagenome]